MNARRFASIAGTVAVTVIAAAASYDHMRLLAERAGQPALLAALLPLSVDGMILVATLALGDGRRSRWSAWLAFLVGVAASLAANVLAAPPGIVARVVSAWPAVALLLTVEVLARSGRAPATAPAQVTATVLRPVPRPTAVRPATVPPGVRTLPIVPKAGRPAVKGPTATAKRPSRAPGVARTAAVARVAAMLADRPHLTGADVAASLGLSDRTARRHLAAARVAATA